MADNLDQLYTALRNADAAGDTEAAKKLASYIRQQQNQQPAQQAPQPEQPKQPSNGDYLTGTIEAAGSLLSGTVAAPVAGIAGLIKGGDAETVKRVQEGLTFQPSSEQGKKVLDIITKPLQWLGEAATSAGDKAMEHGASPEVATAINVAIQSLPAIFLRKTGGAAVRAKPEVLAKTAVESKGVKWDSLPQAVKDSVTAIAEDSKKLKDLTPEQLKSVAQASSLREPVQLTKGQATRDPSQLRAEAQTAQLKGGEPLLQRQEEQNAALNKNVDILRNRVKSAGQDAEAQGKTMSDALKAQEDWSKKRYTALYDKAVKQEGDMPVSTQSLVDFFNENKLYKGSAINDLKKLGAVKVDKEGNITAVKDIPLKDLERIRQEASGAAGNAANPQAKFWGGSLLRHIDDTVAESAGGKAYQEARAAYKAHRQTFDKSSIENIIGEKPSGERRVALENLSQKVISPTTSIENLEGLKRQYLLGGKTPELRRQGRQAWRDLQAGTLDYIKQEAQGALTATRDREFSHAGFKKALDKIGDKKLDMILGKSAANELRKIAKVSEDVKTQPPKRGIGSDTSSNLLTMLDRVGDHLPVIGKYVVGAARQAKRMGEEGKARKESIRAIQALPEKERPKAIYRMGDALLKAQRKPIIPMAEMGAESADTRN